MEVLSSALWALQAAALVGGLLLAAGAALTFAPSPLVEEREVKGDVPFDPWVSLAKGFFSPLKSFVYAAEGAEVPPLALKFRGVVVNPALQAGLHALRRKSHATPAPEQASGVPLFYLEVLSFAQFIVLMTHASFPFALLGSVHARTRIRQEAPLRPDTRLDLAVRVAGSEPHARGTLVHFEALACEAGSEEPVWSNVTTVLFFHARRHAHAKAAAYVAADRGGALLEEGLPLAADTGFAYAALCQDYNPIHLWAWSARLFGFRSAIVHGMCLLEKALPAVLDTAAALGSVPPALRAAGGPPLQAEVETALMGGLQQLPPPARAALLRSAPPAFPLALTVVFRKPVFLPSTPRVAVYAADSAAAAAAVGAWADSPAQDAAGGAAADTARFSGPPVAYEVLDSKGSVCLHGCVALGHAA